MGSIKVAFSQNIGISGGKGRLNRSAFHEGRFIPLLCPPNTPIVTCFPVKYCLSIGLVTVT